MNNRGLRALRGKGSLHSELRNAPDERSVEAILHQMEYPCRWSPHVGPSLLEWRIPLRVAHVATTKSSVVHVGALSPSTGVFWEPL